MKKILCFFFVLVTVVVHSQVSRCASETLLEESIRKSPKIKQQLDSMDRKISRSMRLNRTTALPLPGSITIPVVFYIVHDGTVANDVSDTQVQNQLSVLNNKFSASGIKFCLSTRASYAGNAVPTINTADQQIQNVPGIIHYKKASLMNVYTSSLTSLTSISHYQVTAERYLRIWVVNSIDGPMPGTVGFAGMPGSAFQGIVIRNCAFGTGVTLPQEFREGEILVHEVGHYLGLYHTFHEGCTVTTGDQTLDGDRVSDTPAVAEPNHDCISGINSCPETPAVADLIHNYMDYGDNNCADSFTTKQLERMVSILNLSRSTLVSPDNISYTGTCGYSSLTSAKIILSPEQYTICASPTNGINFSAIDGPNLTWNWNFGDSSTSSLRNPFHIYSSAANSPYTVTLTVTNSSTGEIATSSVKIYVTNCSPINNSDSNWYLGISNLLSFSSGIPVFSTTFPTAPQQEIVQKGCAVQNSATGNLLFYTNGTSIWNNANVQINTVPNAGGVGASEMPPLILPNPNVPNQYYVLRYDTGDNLNPISGLRFSTVNVSGTTATIGLQNQPITQTVTYGMSAANGFLTSSYDGALIGGGVGTITPIKKCDGYWILTLLAKSKSEFYAVVFSLTTAGLKYKSELSITTPAGGVPSFFKVAPNGNKVFLYSPTYTIASYMLDFNKVDGTLSTPIPIYADSSNSQNGFRGAAFSPDSNLLYVSEPYVGLVQYNLMVGNLTASRKIVNLTLGLGNIQQGPDNKLYVSKPYSDGLAVINNPNNLAAASNLNACNFYENGPKRNGATLYQKMSYLPNMLDAKQETAYFATGSASTISIYPSNNGVCNSYKFFPNYNYSNCSSSSFKWIITNTTTGGASVTLSDTNPVYTFTTPGLYSIVLKNFLNIAVLGVKYLQISNITSPSISGSTSACPSQIGNSMTNNSTVLQNNQTAVWSISPTTSGVINGSSTESSVNVNWTSLPATLSLAVTNAANCVATQTQTISSVCPDCSCLPYIYFTQGANLDGSYIIRVNASNQICANLNIKNTWIINGVTSVTYGYASKGYTASGMQNFIVTTDLLAPNGSVLCSSTYNSAGSGNRLSLDYGGAGQMKVTPNPSKGLFNIAIDQLRAKVSIMVLDSNGRVIYQTNDELFDNEKTIDLSNAQSGLYFLKVKAQDIDYTEKIIKN